jgi:hypothetical protein
MIARTRYSLPGPTSIQAAELGNGRLRIVSQSLVPIHIEIWTDAGPEFTDLAGPGDNMTKGLAGVRVINISADSYPVSVLFLSTELASLVIDCALQVGNTLTNPVPVDGAFFDPITFAVFQGLGDEWPGSGSPLSGNGITVEVSADGGGSWATITDQCDATGWTNINAVRVTFVQSDAGSGSVFYGGIDPFALVALPMDLSRNLFNGWPIVSATSDAPPALFHPGSTIARAGGSNSVCGGGIIDTTSGGAFVAPGVVTGPYTYTTVWVASIA